MVVTEISNLLGYVISYVSRLKWTNIWSCQMDVSAHLLGHLFSAFEMDQFYNHVKLDTRHVKFVVRGAISKILIQNVKILTRRREL